MFGIDDALIGMAVGGAANWWGAKEQNYANADQAAKNRDWQENMSNTSWQRGVQDMSAAGLNPMLAYSRGGATTPGGSQAAPMVGPSSAAVSGATQGQSMVAQQQGMQRTQADIDNVKANTAKTIAETPGATATAEGARSIADSLAIELKQLREKMEMYINHPEDKGQNVIRPKAWEEIQSAGLDSDLKEAKSRGMRADSQAAIAPIEARMKEIEAKLQALGVPKAQAYSELYRKGGADVAGVHEMGLAAGGINAAGNALQRGWDWVGKSFSGAMPAQRAFGGLDGRPSRPMVPYR